MIALTLPKLIEDMGKVMTIVATEQQKIQNNDFKVYFDAPVRLNSQDFVSLLNSNYAEINGKVCEILTLQYFEEKHHAIISYKEPFDYADGRVTVITLND
jgi:hypothetical protein